MNFIKTPTKGMRDILPESMAMREYVLNLMKETYKTFGFEMIQTPTVEHIENLTSKQGGDNEKLIFKIMKRGEKLQNGTLDDLDSFVDSGLRYDLTVPLSRYYANNKSLLTTPFRAFQIGNVYRAERNQKGRFREFMQCDLDILGEKTYLAEIELITSITTFLKKLNFTGFTIKINDRKILTKMIEESGLPLEKMDNILNIKNVVGLSIATRSEKMYNILITLDKMDKIVIDGVKEELLSLNLSKENVEKYLKYFEKKEETLEKFCESFKMDEEVVKNLKTIKETVTHLVDAEIIFDPTLVRGMGYYTGPIFEIGVNDLGSSIGGGGRYDKMIEKYANISVPACGFSIGFERLLLLLEERGFQIPEKTEKIAFIIKEESELQEVFKEVQKLRNDGKIVKIVYRNKNIKFQKESLEKENYNIKEW